MVLSHGPGVELCALFPAMGEVGLAMDPCACMVSVYLGPKATIQHSSVGASPG